jgi:hypothetical protein
MTTDGTPIYLYMNAEGVVEGRVGGAEGEVAFDISIDQEGNVTVTQYLSMYHEDDTNPNDAFDLAGLVNAVVTVTDADGDVATSSVGIGEVIQFYDDGPVVTEAEAVALDEDALEGANADDPGVLTDGGDLVTDGVIAWGADGGSITGYTYGSVTTPISLLNDTATIYFGTDGQVTTDAQAAAANLVINADGSYTFTLTSNMLMSGTGEQIDNLQAITLVGADGDGDPISVALTASVQDDIPVVEGTQNAVLANEIGNILTADLGIMFGADGAAAIDAVKISTWDGSKYAPIEDGAFVYDNEGNVLTAKGIDLVYKIESDGSLTAVMDPDQGNMEGYNADYVAFKVSMDPSSNNGTYTVEIIDGLDGGSISEDITYDVAGAVPKNYASGDYDFGDFEAHAYTGLADPGDPATSNLQSNGNWLGVGNSWIGDSKDIQSLAFEFDNSQDNISFTINVKGGSSGTGSWYAYLDGEEVGQGYVSLTDTSVNIQVDGGFDTVIFVSGEKFSYGIGTLSYTEHYETEGQDHTITYQFEATDGDGDTASGTFDVTFDGTGDIEGSAGHDVISGSGGADTFVVGQGDDTILDYSFTDDTVKIGVNFNSYTVEDLGNGDAKLLINLDSETVGSVTLVDIGYSDGTDITTLVNIVDNDGNTIT